MLLFIKQFSVTHTFLDVYVHDRTIVDFLTMNILLDCPSLLNWNELYRVQFQTVD